MQGRQVLHYKHMDYILIRTIAILITSYLTGVGVPMAFALQTGITALLVALLLAVINHTIKPAISIMTLPINILTLGLFSLFVNGLMILLAAAIVPGFVIPSLVMAIWFSVVLAITNWLLSIFERDY